MACMALAPVCDCIGPSSRRRTRAKASLPSKKAFCEETSHHTAGVFNNRRHSSLTYFSSIYIYILTRVPTSAGFLFVLCRAGDAARNAGGALATTRKTTAILLLHKMTADTARTPRWALCKRGGGGGGKLGFCLQQCNPTDAC